MTGLRMLTAAGTFALAAMALGAGVALAQPKARAEPKEACAAPAPPPPALAAWTAPSDLPSARRPAELASAAIVPGKAIIARLHPVAEVEYRVPPEKADGPQVYGGMYALTVTQAGTYRVQSAAGPWIDIMDGKTPVVSTAHGHGPPCTGMGKFVEFPLKPGDYLVQFSESMEPKTEILIALMPN